jgi:alkylhydroperoxidase family enzyme
LAEILADLPDSAQSSATQISDAQEHIQILRNQFFKEQLLELAAQIAFENYRARLNRVFDVGSDELYKPG